MVDFPKPRAGVFALVVLAVIFTPISAQSFGTINGAGQAAEHEKITRLALGRLGFQRKSLNEIAGKRFSFGAVGAPDRAANLITFGPAHCDGGDHLPITGYPQSATDARRALLRCRAWISQNMDRAVTAAGRLLDSKGRIRGNEIPTVFTCTYNGLGGRAKCDVFEALGLLMHASQDFYAHTNWTDAKSSGGTSVTRPPALGNTRTARFILAGSTSRVPRGLISGCFKFLPESAFCKGRIKHDVLNKDKGPINVAKRTVGAGTTPRAIGNRNFQRAVNAAISDTRAQWRVFEKRVRAKYGTTHGNRMICAMKKDNPKKTCP